MVQKTYERVHTTTCPRGGGHHCYFSSCRTCDSQVSRHRVVHPSKACESSIGRHRVQFGTLDAHLAPTNCHLQTTHSTWYSDLHLECQEQFTIVSNQVFDQPCRVVLKSNVTSDTHVFMITCNRDLIPMWQLPSLLRTIEIRDQQRSRSHVCTLTRTRGQMRGD